MLRHLYLPFKNVAEFQYFCIVGGIEWMRFQKLFILVAAFFCGIQSEKGIPSNTGKNSEVLLTYRMKEMNTKITIIYIKMA